MLRTQVALALVLGVGPLAAASGIWVGFRYDATHVLIYDTEKRDDSGITLAEATKRQLPAPIARWGGGGYLLPITVVSQPAPSIGKTVTLALGEELTIPVSVDRHVEQWGSFNSIVRIGVLLRVMPGQLPKFHAARSDYFLVYSGEGPPAVALARSLDALAGVTSVLNRFGQAGELLLVEGEAGWTITLWRKENGKLSPTSVKYSYGD